MIFTDKPGKPDPPKIDKIMKNSVALSWKPPKDDGGAPITNYVVEYKLEEGFKWTEANPDETVPDLKYIVKGLKEGQTYEFRFAAQNKAGVGPASDPTAPVKVKEPVGM